MYENLNSGIGAVIARAMMQHPTSGKVFIVGKAGLAGLNEAQGLFPATHKDGERVFHTTVDSAVNVCLATRGDVIYVLPGHTETITSGSIALDVAGISVVHLGRGKAQAVYTYSATTSKITVGAANITWQGGFHVPAAGIAVVTAFLVGAATDFKLDGGTFEDASSTGAFTSILTTGSTTLAANGLTVVNNYHLGLATSPAAFISILGNTDRLEVANNFVDSAATNDIGHLITIAALVLRGARIHDNILNVVGSAGAVGILMTGSSTTNTGVVYRNYVTSLDTDAALLITAAINLAVHQNFVSGVVAASGVLWPAADTVS